MLPNFQLSPPPYFVVELFDYSLLPLSVTSLLAHSAQINYPPFTIAMIIQDSKNWVCTRLSNSLNIDRFINDLHPRSQP